MARAISNADVSYAGVVIEDELSEVSLNFTVPKADITAFNDAWQNVLAGKPALNISAAGSWDPAASQGDDTIFNDLGGAAQTYDVEPDGTTGYNGYAVIDSYVVTARVNEAIKYTVGMQHNGTAAAADGAAPTRA